MNIRRTDNPDVCFMKTPGVIRLVKIGGDEPVHVPDAVIDAIRKRERDGAIDLPQGRGLKAGDRVQIITSLLVGRRGRYAGALRRHVRVLLQMLGIERQVQLSANAVEPI